jgi:hypothetical protein
MSDEISTAEINRREIDMDAYDALPPRLRRILADGPFNLDARIVLGFFFCHGEPAAENVVNNTFRKYLEQGNV